MSRRTERGVVATFAEAFTHLDERPPDYRFDCATLPPGVNHLYPTRGGRRVKSAEYIAWQEAELWRLKAAYPAPPDHGPACWTLTALFTLPNWRRHDLDGMLKSLIDTLAEGLRLDDNRLVTICTAKLVSPVATATCQGVIHLVD